MCRRRHSIHLFIWPGGKTVKSTRCTFPNCVLWLWLYHGSDRHASNTSNNYNEASNQTVRRVDVCACRCARLRQIVIYVEEAILIANGGMALNSRIEFHCLSAFNVLRLVPHINSMHGILAWVFLFCFLWFLFFFFVWLVTAHDLILTYNIISSDSLQF